MMILIDAIKRNLNFLRIHFYIWLIKFLLIYLSFEPLRSIMSSYFDDKTINQDLLQYSDSSALFEFIWHIIDNTDNPLIIIIVMICLLSLLMIILDAILDAGFFAVYAQRDTKIFLAGIKQNAGRMILLKLMLLIPYILMLIFIAVPLFSIFNPVTYQFPLGDFNLIWSLLLLFVLASPGLFFLKVIDHAKSELIINNVSTGEALMCGFNHMFDKAKYVLINNLLFMLILCVGIYLYYQLNHALHVDSGFAILLMTLMFQCVVFSKQVLRYCYSSMVMELEYRLPVHVVKNRQSDGDQESGGDLDSKKEISDT